MTKNGTYGARLIAAMTEAVDIERGRAKPAAERRVALTARSATVEAAPNYGPTKIAHLREELQVSQPVFAEMLNVSAETVRAWEQGKRRPDGAAVRLLQMAEEHPTWLRAKVQGSKRVR